MSRRSRDGLGRVFAGLGGLLLAFLLLPLLNTFLTVRLGDLALTLADRQVLASLALTFGAAGAATALAALTGLPLAYLLAHRRFPAHAWVSALIDLPLVLPHTAAGIALLLVFGRQGWIGRPLAALGLTFTDQPAGIVVAMLFVSLPFLVDASREAFAAVEVELEQAARVEGASEWDVFWRVSLPIAWGGVREGMLMMWARGVSEFGAIIILAYHPKVLPVLVYERLESFGLRAAQPVAVVLILTVFLVFGLLRLWSRRAEKF